MQVKAKNGTCLSLWWIVKFIYGPTFQVPLLPPTLSHTTLPHFHKCLFHHPFRALSCQLTAAQRTMIYFSLDRRLLSVQTSKTQRHLSLIVEFSAVWTELFGVQSPQLLKPLQVLPTLITRTRKGKGLCTWKSEFNTCSSLC